MMPDEAQLNKNEWSLQAVMMPSFKVCAVDVLHFHLLKVGEAH